jgi:predicted Zn-dependent protease
LLAGRYGRDKLRQMLQLWGEGKSTAEVLHSALGITGQELDRQFDAYLEQRLQRYGAQFMATALSVDAAQLQIQLEHSPRDRQLRLQKALLLLEVNKPSEAERVLAALVREDAQDAQASFALARTLLLTGEPGAAHERLQSLLAQGHDGYEIQLLLARSQQAQGEDFAGALQAAHEADPTQEEALFGLWQLARQAGDSAGELRWLRELAPLARHSPDVYRRYLELLLRQGRVEDALAVGQSAVFVDIEGLHTHLLYAQALLRSGRWAAAQTEFDSALLCPGSDADRAQAHLAYAEALDQRGQRARADEQRAVAARLQRESDTSAVKTP